MGAKGNKFWEKRSSHGRNPIFKNEDELLSACMEYFDWCHENPLFEMKPFNVNNEITQEPVAKMRAMTMGGLQIFLDINRQTWANYKAKEDFIAVIEQVEEIIRDQKFTGAASGLFNANIIARDLGLKDGSENTISGPDGGPIPIFEFTPVNDED